MRICLEKNILPDMQYQDLIHARRSIRAYKDTPVPDDALERILEAGRMAPSQTNLQNWMFGIVTDKRLRKHLARATEQTWVEQAPMIIAVCSNVILTPETHKYDKSMELDALRFGPDFIDYLCSYKHDRSIGKLWCNNAALPALVQMHLASANEGLSSCIVNHFDIETASRHLKLPKEWACMFMLPLGYADEEPEPEPRMQLPGLTFQNKWSQMYF